MTKKDPEGMTVVLQHTALIHKNLVMFTSVKSCIKPLLIQAKT